MKKIYKTPETHKNQIHGKYDMLVDAVGGSIRTNPGNQNAKEIGDVEVDDNDFWGSK